MDGPAAPEPLRKPRWAPFVPFLALAALTGVAWAGVGVWTTMDGTAPVAGPEPAATNDPADGTGAPGHQHGAAVTSVQLPTADAPFDGPAAATDMIAACAPTTEWFDCYADLLMALLTARGSEVAFTALEDLARIEPWINTNSHPLAHVLGQHAFGVYGTIQTALETCSYRVFQGCFHGALQAHFSGLPQINASSLEGLCPLDQAFREYVCLHGVGHGLMLATRLDLNRSLDLCDTFDTYHARSSCYGGVVMENVVGWMNARSGAHQATGGHGHEAFVPEDYTVKWDDLFFPCNVIKTRHQPTCWLMQTSLILYINGGDFRGAALVCDQLQDENRRSCFTSMGRDASAWRLRDPVQVGETCALAPPDGRSLCIRGYIVEVALNYADPFAGLPRCQGVPEEDKPSCYNALAGQASSMITRDRLEELCDQAEPAYRGTCRAGAGLPTEEVA